MGDKTKLKLGSLGANVKEDFLLSRLKERVERQQQSAITDIEKEQTAVVKRFQESLKRSAKLAREHERLQMQLEVQSLRAPAMSSGRYIWSCVPYRTIDIADSRGTQDGQTLQNKTAHTSKKVQNWTGLEHAPSAMKSSPAHTGFDFSASDQTFPPYKRNSYSREELYRPATRLEIRSLMWQKTIYCPESRQRAKSAPAWTRNARAPERILRAQDKAAHISCLSSSLLQPPCKQAQIDVQELREKRKKEVVLENEAVKRFSSSLEPYKIQESSGRMETHDVTAYYSKFASTM